MNPHRFTFKYFLISAISSTAMVNADLVAYFPVDSATDSSTFLNDVIDDATHGVSDGTTSNENASIVFNATRGGDVLSTVEGHRYTAGTQNIDLNEGFTWSLWVNVASSNVTDAGADVVIGTRNGGPWHKVDRAGISNWNGTELTYPDLSDDTWHHIGYVGDELERRIYIDGTLVDTDTSITVLTVDLVMEIGGSSRFSEDITGLYDDIAIWNERLSEAEIVAIANGAPIVPGTGGGGDLVVTSVSYEAATDSATLTWRANPNSTYKVFASTDLVDWANEVATGVDSTTDEDLTDEGFFTTTIDLAGEDLPGESKLFFRVEED